MINSSTQANLQAWIISLSVAFLLPQRRLSFIVPENKRFFCNTTATLFRKVSRSYSLTLCPPTFTTPSLASYNLLINCINVVFEEPVPPIIPIVSPELIVKLILARAWRLALSEYLKFTF